MDAAQSASNSPPTIPVGTSSAPNLPLENQSIIDTPLNLQPPGIPRVSHVVTAQTPTPQITTPASPVGTQPITDLPAEAPTYIGAKEGNQPTVAQGYGGQKPTTDSRIPNIGLSAQAGNPPPAHIEPFQNFPSTVVNRTISANIPYPPPKPPTAPNPQPTTDNRFTSPKSQSNLDEGGPSTTAPSASLRASNPQQPTTYNLQPKTGNPSTTLGTSPPLSPQSLGYAGDFASAQPTTYFPPPVSPPVPLPDSVIAPPPPPPIPSHKFPFMAISLILLVVVTGFSGSFLFFRYSNATPKKIKLTPLVTPPVTQAVYAQPTIATVNLSPSPSVPANPFATPTVFYQNPFATPSTTLINPFGTFANPFATPTVTQASTSTITPYQNPFENLK